MAMYFVIILYLLPIERIATTTIVGVQIGLKKLPVAHLAPMEPKAEREPWRERCRRDSGNRR